MKGSLICGAQVMSKMKCWNEQGLSDLVYATKNSTDLIFNFLTFLVFVHDFLYMQAEKIENYSINDKETKFRTEVNKILNDSDIYFCNNSNNSFHSFCPCSLHNLPRLIFFQSFLFYVDSLNRMLSEFRSVLAGSGLKLNWVTMLYIYVIVLIPS